MVVELVVQVLVLRRCGAGAGNSPNYSSARVDDPKTLPR